MINCSADVYNVDQPTFGQCRTMVNNENNTKCMVIITAPPYTLCIMHHASFVCPLPNKNKINK